MDALKSRQLFAQRLAFFAEFFSRAFAKFDRGGELQRALRLFLLDDKERLHLSESIGRLTTRRYPLEYRAVHTMFVLFEPSAKQGLQDSQWSRVCLSRADLQVVPHTLTYTDDGDTSLSVKEAGCPDQPFLPRQARRQAFDWRRPFHGGNGAILVAPGIPTGIVGFTHTAPTRLPFATFNVAHLWLPFWRVVRAAMPVLAQIVHLTKAAPEMRPLTAGQGAGYVLSRWHFTPVISGILTSLSARRNYGSI